MTLLPNATIKAGTKSLKFLEIVPKKKQTKGGGKKGAAKAGAEEGSKSAKDASADDSVKKEKA